MLEAFTVKPAMQKSNKLTQYKKLLRFTYYHICSIFALIGARQVIYI